MKPRSTILLLASCLALASAVGWYAAERNTGAPSAAVNVVALPSNPSPTLHTEKSGYIQSVGSNENHGLPCDLGDRRQGYEMMLKKFPDFTQAHKIVVDHICNGSGVNYSLPPINHLSRNIDELLEIAEPERPDYWFVMGRLLRDILYKAEHGDDPISVIVSQRMHTFIRDQLAKDDPYAVYMGVQAAAYTSNDQLILDVGERVSDLGSMFFVTESTREEIDFYEMNHPVFVSAVYQSMVALNPHLGVDWNSFLTRYKRDGAFRFSPPTP
jgi:hypothetical protein